MRSLLGRRKKKNKDDLDYFDAEGFGHEEEMRDAVLVAVDQAVHEVDILIARGSRPSFLQLLIVSQSSIIFFSIKQK